MVAELAIRLLSGSWVFSMAHGYAQLALGQSGAVPVLVGLAATALIWMSAMSVYLLFQFGTVPRWLSLLPAVVVALGIVWLQDRVEQRTCFENGKQVKWYLDTPEGRQFRRQGGIDSRGNPWKPYTLEQAERDRPYNCLPGPIPPGPAKQSGTVAPLTSAPSRDPAPKSVGEWKANATSFSVPDRSAKEKEATNRGYTVVVQSCQALNQTVRCYLTLTNRTGRDEERATFHKGWNDAPQGVRAFDEVGGVHYSSWLTVGTERVSGKSFLADEWYVTRAMLADITVPIHYEFQDFPSETHRITRLDFGFKAQASGVPQFRFRDVRVRRLDAPLDPPEPEGVSRPKSMAPENLSPKSAPNTPPAVYPVASPRQPAASVFRGTINVVRVRLSDHYRRDGERVVLDPGLRSDSRIAGDTVAVQWTTTIANAPAPIWVRFDYLPKGATAWETKIYVRDTVWLRTGDKTWFFPTTRCGDYHAGWYRAASEPVWTSHIFFSKPC